MKSFRSATLLRHSSCALNQGTLLALLALSALLVGCADSSAIITGHVRPATTPEQVQTFLQPPTRKYEVIGLVSASNHNRPGISRQGKTDQALKQLKIKAAELGANGVIIQQTGTETSAAGGVVSGGVFVAGIDHDVSISGTAIFVP